MDGGLTRSDRCSQLQADSAGVPVQRGAVDATVAGAAALAAVGAGIWESTPRSPSGSRSANGRTRPRRRLAPQETHVARLRPMSRGA